VTRSAESAQSFGGPAGVVVVVTVVLGAGDPDVCRVGDALADGDADADALLDVRRLPLAGGLLGGEDASGTPCGRTFAAPRTDGVALPPSNAPIAQTNNTAPTPSPAMAIARRRRYTDGESGPLGSFTSGN
jgi:hypothetical protein